MDLYKIPAANGQLIELAGTERDARTLCKDRGIRFDRSMSIDFPTKKWDLLNAVNLLIAEAIQSDTFDPLRGPPFEPIAEMDDHGQPVEDPLGNGEEYGVAPVVSHKPAFTQARVDAMFADKADGPLPSVDDVCLAISEMRGAAIGHVAHELAARVETLAKEVAGG